MSYCRATHLELEAGDNYSIEAEVTIKLSRIHHTVTLAAAEPRADDLPADFREALLQWLGIDTDLLTHHEPEPPVR